jgi:uncharacterized damage-inducible protein DinB
VRVLDSVRSACEPAVMTAGSEAGPPTKFVGQRMRGAEFRHVDLRGATFEHVDLNGSRMRGVELVDVEISGEIRNLRINDVDVVPLVNAELDRRDPNRAKMRPTDPDGFREAWDIIEQLWDQTVQRARGFDPELLHASVDDEWSFIETLRHLVFASDAWIRRAIMGEPAPWSALDLPWDQMPDTPGVPRDREARPTLDEVMILRRDRMGIMRQLVDELTDEELAAHTDPVEGPGWPQPRSYPVRECLSIVLNEEWHHRLYAERDLDALASHAAETGQHG